MSKDITIPSAGPDFENLLGQEVVIEATQADATRTGAQRIEPDHSPRARQAEGAHMLAPALKVDYELRQEVEQLLYRQAELLDAKQWQAWMDLFDDQGEHQAYESLFTWHPEKKKLIFLSIGAEGGIFEGTTEAKGDTFESVFTSYGDGKAATFKQVIKFLDDDHVLWTVFGKKGDEWTKLFEVPEHREKGDSTAK